MPDGERAFLIPPPTLCFPMTKKSGRPYTGDSGKQEFEHARKRPDGYWMIPGDRLPQMWSVEAVKN